MLLTEYSLVMPRLLCDMWTFIEGFHAIPPFCVCEVQPPIEGCRLGYNV